MAVNRKRRAVLKNDKVHVLGRRRLPPIGAAGAGPAARAEIIGQTDTEVLIRVTCSCGEQIELQCAYNDKAARPGAQTPQPAEHEAQPA